MLSKTVMFRLMNLRMRILSSFATAAAAAAVGVVEGRRGAQITLRLPSLVDESSSNGKISKYDFLCQDLFGIYDLVAFCFALYCCSVLLHVDCIESTITEEREKLWSQISVFRLTKLL